MAPNDKAVVKVNRKIKLLSNREKLSGNSTESRKRKPLYGEGSAKEKPTSSSTVDDIGAKQSTSLKPAEKVAPVLTADGFRRQHQLKISGGGDPARSFVIPDPMINFEATPFAKSICQGMK